jgi:hypothetical protein
VVRCTIIADMLIRGICGHLEVVDSERDRIGIWVSGEGNSDDVLPGGESWRREQVLVEPLIA